MSDLFDLILDMSRHVLIRSSAVAFFADTLASTLVKFWHV